MLRYLATSRSIDPKEKELLTSHEIATRVVSMVRPEKILARNGGRNDPTVATEIVGSGIEVSSSLSSIITVSFRNRDKNIVQPVLDALIHAYVHKHLEMHTGAGILDGYWVKVKDLGENLTQTEETLRRAKTNARVPFADDSKIWYETRIGKAQDELETATRALAERHALLIKEMEKLEKEERKLLRQGYRETHPLVQTVRGQLRNLSVQKAKLEKDFPALNQVSLAGMGSSTNSEGGDVASLLAEIKTLSARVAYSGNALSNIQVQIAQVRDWEPKIAELERERAQLQGSYDSVVARLAKVMAGGANKDDTVININVVQDPSPPRLDVERILKRAGATLVGCIATAVGLAFLLDFIMDRSIGSTTEVERLLRVPVFLAIPDTAYKKGFRLPRLWRSTTAGSEVTKVPGAAGEFGLSGEMTSSAGHPLSDYAEELGECVCNYFKVHEMDLKSPKLVALTGCERGAGVSTLANGLAGELSKTADRHVLLLDMSSEQGRAHSFFRGKPGCGVSDVVTSANRGPAQAKEKLYMIPTVKGLDPELTKVLSKRFNYLLPKLRANDYDLIVFDMPAVSPTSVTARLAACMDLTLLILEAEKTGQEAAARAKGLLHKAYANVAAVLNKCQSGYH